MVAASKGVRPQPWFFRQGKTWERNRTPRNASSAWMRVQPKTVIPSSGDVTSDPQKRAPLFRRGTPPDPRIRARFARHTGRRLHLQAKCLIIRGYTRPHRSVYGDCEMLSRKPQPARHLTGRDRIVRSPCNHFAVGHAVGHAVGGAVVLRSCSRRYAVADCCQKARSVCGLPGRGDWPKPAPGDHPPVKIGPSPWHKDALIRRVARERSRDVVHHGSAAGLRTRQSVWLAGQGETGSRWRFRSARLGPNRRPDSSLRACRPCLNAAAMPQRLCAIRHRLL